MTDLMLEVDLDDLFALIAQLSPEQKRAVRERLDEDWSARFGQALDAIHSRIPADIREDEANADIEQAIREVRAGRR